MFYIPRSFKERKDMANLKNAGFDKIVPSLKASDLKGAEGTIITVRVANVVSNRNQGRNQRKNLLEIKTVEWPDKVYRPNNSGIGELMSQLGDDSDNWIGKKIPLIVEPANNPQTGDEVEALHVAPAAQWKELLADVEAPPAKKR
jgi:hypothetical protein